MPGSSPPAIEIASLPGPPGGVVPANALILVVVPPPQPGDRSAAYAVTLAQIAEMFVMQVANGVVVALPPPTLSATGTVA